MFDLKLYKILFLEQFRKKVRILLFSRIKLKISHEFDFSYFIFFLFPKIFTFVGIIKNGGKKNKQRTFHF